MSSSCHKLNRIYKIEKENMNDRVKDIKKERNIKKDWIRWQKHG